jgi:Ca2+-binding EF-hand superfamily protein
VLLLAGAIGLADVLFAFDSISAVFGITTSAALVLACNAFALMGLRQLYVLVTGVLGQMRYLNAGLAVICAFVGTKLLLQALHGSGVSWARVLPAWLSVLVIASVLAATVLAGLAAGQLRRSGRLRRSDRLRSMLERRFAVLDANGNGVLDAGDAQLATRRLCEAFGYAADSGPARAVAGALGALFDRMLAHMDANGDRVISRDEFLTAANRKIGDQAGFDAAAGATARSVIKVADTDGNGVLDAGEYTRLAAVYGVAADRAARIFGRLDLDGNGVLDAAELGQAISHFCVPL